MMLKPQPDVLPASLCVLRAVAADGAESWHLPASASQRRAGLNGSDPLATLALNAAAFLLADLSPECLVNLGLIVGTTLGCLETDRIFDRSRRDSEARFASPAAFSRTLASSIPAEIALAFHITGPTLVVSAGGGSAAVALRRAAAWMHQNNLDFCVAGGLDLAGPGLPVPETCRAALLLLARAGSGIGKLRIGAYQQADLLALQDGSLERIIQGIRNGGETALGAGVVLDLR